MKKIIALILVVAMALCIFAGCEEKKEEKAKDNDNNNAPVVENDPTVSENEVVQTQPIDIPSSDYNAVFSNHNIVHIDSVFLGLDSAAYAYELEDGTICCEELGYKDDIVHTYLLTYYFDISDSTEEEKAEVDSYIRQEFAPFEAISYVTLNYNMLGDYYCVSIRVENLDQADIRADAIANGLIETDGDVLSVSATLEQAEDNGFAIR